MDFFFFGKKQSNKVEQHPEYDATDKTLTVVEQVIKREHEAIHGNNQTQTRIKVEGVICHAENYQIDCYGSECKAHIVTQNFTRLRKDEKNILKLCKGHETFFNDVGIEEWFEFVKKKFPENFKYVSGHHKKAISQYQKAKQVLHEYEILLKL